MALVDAVLEVANGLVLVVWSVGLSRHAFSIAYLVQWNVCRLIVVE
jgi:hypothetical protein